jgi:hypothetical protein
VGPSKDTSEEQYQTQSNITTVSSEESILSTRIEPLMRLPSLYSYDQPVTANDDLQVIRRLLAESFLGKLVLRLRPPDYDLGAEPSLTVSILHSSLSHADSFAATGVASSIGMLFGAVHCAAWNFNFVTPKERILWHVWSAVIATVPIALCIRSVMGYALVKATFLQRGLMRSDHDSLVIIFMWASIRYISLASLWVTTLLVPIYVVARLGLLIQAVLALRNLLPGERAQVQWVNLLPHL